MDDSKSPPSESDPQFVAGNGIDSSGDFHMQKVDCPSAEDWNKKLAPKAFVPIEPPKKPDWQFGLQDGVLAISAMSAGLAGGHWMPWKIYLGLLGLTVFLAIFLWPMLELLLDWSLDDILRARIITFFLIAYGAASMTFLLVSQAG